MTPEAKVRLFTWLGLTAGVVGALLIAFPKMLPVGGPWVQLALGILTLVLAFRARRVGMSDVEGFDGRLSLAAALLGFLVVFFAGQVAFGILVAAAN
ncbi:hypothetical protein [Microbacterium sp. XT11]|uniref:hypothetical protein n=1 Tax=Microbacterium sp. XT11 TaxID=367477 RepID=UPI0007431460|nr:hypothetical protein [Microbacterium sp. XT11]ALX65827.1 hypothetical protein AB663_000559 [Microbacterium sp. XT11]